MSSLARIGVLQRRLEGVAEEMGALLVRSALSPNITERRDSSTALFDARGRLLAQAAHIPVHLGSMRHAVDSVRRHEPGIGEAWLLNDPYDGGTHLPDLTLVSCLSDVSGRPIGYAAVRAHHADVGGAGVGSMRPGSLLIEEEGVRIAPVLIARDGCLLDDVIDRIIAAMRQPHERRGDLLAQLAALRVAERRLPSIMQSIGGVARFDASCDQLLEYGARRARASFEQHVGASGSAIRMVELPAGVPPARIECSVHVADDGVTIDLRGTSAHSRSSLNCPRAVTDAAVAFAVRVVFDPDLPTCGGVDEVITTLTTPGSMVDARYPAAVAGGNVEVSSVIVDTVIAACAAFTPVPADGQGTMNNLVLGNDQFSYYETIAGGQGASSTAPGPSAVHVAMTNTRNTPIEALELAFPLEVVRYAIRRGSGGSGARDGGDGVIRSIRVLEPCELSLLSQRRQTSPSGRAGGSDGATGAQRINREPVDGLLTRQLAAGDVIEILTPGGGGYGSPNTPRR